MEDLHGEIMMKLGLLIAGQDAITKRLDDKFNDVGKKLDDHDVRLDDLEKKTDVTITRVGFYSAGASSAFTGALLFLLHKLGLDKYFL